MPLLSSELSVWEIAHRWAGYDPLLYRPWLPLPVRDNFRILINAILNGEIDSETLQIRKWKTDDGIDSQRYFIRYYMDDVYACIWGKKFNRTLLKQASIDRYEMKQWCELHSIPPPEFWFPTGWGYSYHWEGRDVDLEADTPAGQDEPAVRPSTIAKVASQQIARGLWKENPDMTIADMVKQPMVQRYGGGAVYTPATVREWLSAVAPSDVKNKRGRPRKKIPGEHIDAATTAED